MHGISDSARLYASPDATLQRASFSATSLWRVDEGSVFGGNPARSRNSQFRSLTCSRSATRRIPLARRVPPRGTSRRFRCLTARHRKPSRREAGSFCTVGSYCGPFRCSKAKSGAFQENCGSIVTRGHAHMRGIWTWLPRGHVLDSIADHLINRVEELALGRRPFVPTRGPSGSSVRRTLHS
jgi:hypothetical protein